MISLDVVRVTSDVHPFDPPRLTVYVGGEVDMATAPAIEATVRSFTAQPHHVVVDLTQVTFMDSSGIGVMVELRRLVPAGHPEATFSLAGLAGNVERLFKAARLMSVFPIVEAVPRPAGPMPV